VWRELRDELSGSGFELVTVALETRGWAEAARWIDAAEAVHPSLLDDRHALARLYGIVNVPTGFWIDEAGTLVRPPETAFPRRSPLLDTEIPDTVNPRLREVLEESRKLNADGRPYAAALRDWVEHGVESRFALGPQAVLDRLRQRSPDACLGAAHFELGVHLQQGGDPARAVAHFKAAHRLAPADWAQKRQAWSLVDRTQSPNEVYATGWLEEVRASGAANYYPEPDL
jgi:hypothetical protein